MIGSVPAGRRAQAFAEALDEPDRELGGEPADGDHEQTRLLALTDGLTSLPRPAMNPEVKTVQRAQLIAAMETAVADGTLHSPDGRVPAQRAGRGGRGTHRADGGARGLGKLRPRTRLGRGLAAGGLSVGVAASALGGAAAASTNALPGDTLYGLKLGMEDLRLGLADSDSERGRLHLDHAATRLREAGRLLDRGDADRLDHESLGEVRKALSGMRHDASEGHRLLSKAYAEEGRIDVMQSLSSFSQDHRFRWAELRERLPVQLSDVGAEVSSVFDAMEDEVEPLRRLFPSRSGQGGAPDRQPESTRQQEPENQRTETGGDTRPSSPPAASDSGQDRSDSPEPSGSRSGDGGLLGGSGLLDPPSEPSAGESGTGPDSDAPDWPEPDITLPPLVPEVLPGLGVEAEKE